MNKAHIAIIGIIVIAVIGGVFVFIRPSTPPEVMMKKDESTEKIMTTPEPQDAMMNKSRYQGYTSDVFKESANTRRVLFFYASWCPTCRPADKNFEENVTKIPSDVTLIRVNYNDSDTDQEEKDLAKTYQVTYQHTFVEIDPAGKEVTRWNGGQISELLQNIQ